MTPDELRKQWDNDLALVRLDDGNPSLDAIRKRAERIGLPISKTTLWRLLTPGEMPEPQWEYVQAFLYTCGISAEVVEADWLPKWKRLLAAAKGILIAPEITMCPVCTAMVGDLPRHMEHHPQENRPTEDRSTPGPLRLVRDALAGRSRPRQAG